MKLKCFSRVDDFALTRFANNTIHQNVATKTIWSRCAPFLADVQLAPPPTSLTTTACGGWLNLQKLSRRCSILIRIFCRCPTRTEAAGSASGSVRRHRTSRPATSNKLRPSRLQLRAAGVKKIVEVAEKHKLTAAGIFSSSESVEGIFNSRGLSDWHTQTLAEVSITMLGADSSGWQKANSPDVAKLDPLAMAEIAAKKALDSAHPAEIPAGKCTVILEPAAVLDIVGFMFWDYSGTAILDERSFLSGRIGSQLFGENITIWDDVTHPLQTGSPFDGEGMRRLRVPLVENGVVKRVVYARGTAVRMKNSEYKDKVGPVEATGHGFVLPNEMGEMPLNIVFAPPQNPQTLDQMIASTERGVLVTRLWYIREVDPYEKIVTGMTRDGTFLVENGKVQRGLRNFRFNQSLIHMLSEVEAMSMPVRSCGEESFDMVVPAMKVRDFNFTEVTKF